MRHNNKIDLLVFIGIILIVLAPWLFTRDAILPQLNFLETGNIGDTIGGITAPFVGVLSIVLLYCTLQSQNEFNKHRRMITRSAI